YQGRLDTALALCERALALCESKALLIWLPAAAGTLGWALALAGRGAEGAAHLERACSAMEATGGHGNLAHMYIWGADALLSAGRLPGEGAPGSRRTPHAGLHLRRARWRSRPRDRVLSARPRGGHGARHGAAGGPVSSGIGARLRGDRGKGAGANALRPGHRGLHPAGTSVLVGRSGRRGRRLGLGDVVRVARHAMHANQALLLQMVRHPVVFVRRRPDEHEEQQRADHDDAEAPARAARIGERERHADQAEGAPAAHAQARETPQRRLADVGRGAHRPGGTGHQPHVALGGYPAEEEEEDADGAPDEERAQPRVLGPDALGSRLLLAPVLGIARGLSHLALLGSTEPWSVRAR